MIAILLLIVGAILAIGAFVSIDRLMTKYQASNPQVNAEDAKTGAPWLTAPRRTWQLTEQA